MSYETEFKNILQLDSELNQIQDYELLLERILFESRRVVHADAGSIYITVPDEKKRRNNGKVINKIFSK